MRPELPQSVGESYGLKSEQQHSSEKEELPLELWELLVCSHLQTLCHLPEEQIEFVVILINISTEDKERYSLQCNDFLLVFSLTRSKEASLSVPLVKEIIEDRVLVMHVL